MFSTAAWVLDQEYKALKWLRGHPGTSGGKTWSQLTTPEQVFMTGAGTSWVVAHGYVAFQPYARIFGYAADLDLKVREAKLAARNPSGFSIIRGKLFPRFAKKQTTKLAMMKLGSRAIPYLGWGLLAYDLWNLGKWIGSKTDNPIEYFLPTS